MEDAEIVKRLEAGPGQRQLRLVEERRDHTRLRDAPAVVRNLMTLIYPGYDLAVGLRAEREQSWLPLGCLAIGRVEVVQDENLFADSTANPAASGETRPPVAGDLIYWNGPHANVAGLDPDRHIWTSIPSEIDVAKLERLLFAGIGAEAQVGLDLALERLGRTPGSVLVFGQGLLGHLAGQWLRYKGASVVVVDNSPKRLEFSRKSGLKQRVDLHNFDWRERIERYSSGGVDLIVDATGAAEALARFMPFLCPGGILCLLGRWREAALPDEVAERLTPEQLVEPPPGLGRHADHPRLIAEWLNLIASEKIPTERLITHRVDPIEALMAMKRYQAGIRSWLGTVIDWSPPAD